MGNQSHILPLQFTSDRKYFETHWDRTLYYELYVECERHPLTVKLAREVDSRQ